MLSQPRKMAGDAREYLNKYLLILIKIKTLRLLQKKISNKCIL